MKTKSIYDFLNQLGVGGQIEFKDGYLYLEEWRIQNEGRGIGSGELRFGFKFWDNNRETNIKSDLNDYLLPAEQTDVILCQIESN